MTSNYISSPSVPPAPRTPHPTTAHLILVLANQKEPYYLKQNCVFLVGNWQQSHQAKRRFGDLIHNDLHQRDTHPHPHHTQILLRMWIHQFIGRVTEEEKKKHHGVRRPKSHCIQCLFSLWIVVKNDLFNHLDSEAFSVREQSFFITSAFCWPFLGLLYFHQAIGILSESVAGKRSLSWMHNTVCSTWDQKWRIIAV